MREPAFWFPAYHGAMEIILLFFLFAAQSDPAFAEKLRAFLSFYRENRDLVALLTKNGLPMSEAEHAEPPEREEHRPNTKDGAEKVLEALLNKLG